MVLSIVTSQARVRIMLKLDAKRLTKNIVFLEVLLRLPADT